MRVTYDYQVFEWQKYGGVSRYICELATHLSEYEDVEVQILAIAYVNEYLKQCRPDLVVGFPIPKIQKMGKVRRAVNSSLSKLWLSQHPPDILHQTYYQPLQLAPKGTKVVTNIHDMNHEKFSEFFPGYQAPKEKQESVKRADHVICISENTRKDLIEIMGVEPQKVSVVYLGSSLTPLKDEGFTPITDAPYLLFVGDRGGYKNFQRLLRAYASSPSLQKDFKLVCFGKDPFNLEELHLIEELKLTTGQVLRVSGDDRLLTYYYQRASLFVYPSLYEGFGLPLVEAMSVRCPIACSNTSSLPEVAGDAAEIFNPYEVESIAAALEKVLYSDGRAAELVRLGSDRAQKFTWQACAEETRRVYLSLLHN